MDLRKLQRLVVDALEDVKGQNIEVYDSTPITELFDRVVVVSGTSNRQTRALAMHLRDQAKAAGIEQVRIEGEDTGEWVLVDLGDVIVHVMQPAIREYYNLEELWGAKKVRVRLGASGKTGTDEPEDEEVSIPKPASVTPRKAAAKKPAKPASGAKAGSKTRASGTPARKAAAPRKAATPRGGR